MLEKNLSLKKLTSKNPNADKLKKIIPKKLILEIQRKNKKKFQKFKNSKQRQNLTKKM